MKKWFGITGWVAAVLLVAGSVSGQHEEHQKADSPEQPKAPGPDMCKMMQDKMGSMHTKMKQKHDELQHMVNEMNTATGQDKVDAIARVVTSMVDEQNQMHNMEMGMMQEMMSHMGQHMMQGMAPESKKEMMMCPMMDSMKGHGAPGEKKEAPEANPASEHEQHH